MFIVYKLTNGINGKSYIGISSRALNVRWLEHLERLRQAKRGGNRLYAALAKYGPGAFTAEIVAHTSSEDEVRKLETANIVKFDTYNSGYNCNLGGCGFLKFPEHIRRKIGQAQKGKVIPLEVREKMSRAKLGDKRCGKHFGAHTNKGSANPRAKAYRMQFPDGTVHSIVGMRDFCRRNGLHLAHINARGKSKGYVLLERFNDYPEREYTQAGGNGGGPETHLDRDIVCSAR